MNTPRTRMQRFDMMTPDERELANEYGVNVVVKCRASGAEGDELRDLCEQHRQTRQQSQLVSIKPSNRLGF